MIVASMRAEGNVGRVEGDKVWEGFEHREEDRGDVEGYSRRSGGGLLIYVSRRIMMNGE